MSDAWYIDALDGLSGLAFASHRPPTLTEAAYDLDAPAWFLAAPDFRPELVGSRALALAATRGSFQLGLSVDGETEVPFPTLAALIEFVRRLYIAGGGGDGAGGVGPTPPAPPEGEGPSPERVGPIEPREREAMHPAEQGLFGFAEASKRDSLNLKAGMTATRIKKRASQPATSAQEVVAEPLQLAADLIAAALLRAEREEDTAGHEAWLVAVGQFRYLLLAAHLELLHPGPAYELFYEIGWPDPFGAHFWSRCDPLDRLAVLPIPRFVGESERGEESWRSLKDLLFGILARPGCLIDSKYSAQRAALLLFAAVALVPGGASPFWPPARRGTAAVHAGLLARAFDWISAQWPDHVFAPELEEIIDAVTLTPRPQGAAR